MKCCLKTSMAYLDPKSNEEREIRNWEASLGCFSIEFNRCQQRIMNSRVKLPVRQVEKVMEEEFTQEFKVFLQAEDLQTTVDGAKYIHAEKLGYLFFLLSAQGIVYNNSTYYSDKAFFIYLRTKDREEDDLSQGIDSNNSRLKEVTRSLCQLACETIPRMYYKTSGLSREGFLEELHSAVDGATDLAIKDLFTVGGKLQDILDLKQLKGKFNEENFFFSSGFFREKAYEYMDQSRREKLLKKNK